MNTIRRSVEFAKRCKGKAGLVGTDHGGRRQAYFSYDASMFNCQEPRPTNAGSSQMDVPVRIR